MTTTTETSVQQRLEGFDAWLEEQMAHWQIPGVAVAVVHKGEVVLSKGYGLRDVEKNLPVTPETLFAIGSCSKAFTSFDIALLVKEGKLAWDTPLRQYLPDFRLSDPVATEGMTPRELVCHRSGLPRHDFTWYGSPFTRRELFQRLQYLKASYPFRAMYQYNNLMFMTAGYLVGEVAGTSWEEFTRRRIFEPLGMTGSNLSVEESKHAPDASLPYELKDGQPKAVPFRNLDNAAPAGSINSSITDMVKWLKVHMYGDDSLLPRDAIKAMHAPHTVIPSTPEMPWDESEVNNTTYALGWATQVYRGHHRVWHTGGIDGFISSTSFFPHDDLGVIVLTNLGNNNYATMISFNLYDRLLGLDQLPWVERIDAFIAKMKAMGEEAKQKALAGRKEGTQPSRPLADYAGSYQHPGYGSLTVRLEGDKLKAIYNGLELALEHHHYDVFVLSGTADDADLFLLVPFEGSAEGNIARVRVGFEPSVEPIVFERAKS
jgi:CubicO group peptidase (beta-lactamase class C family)